MRKNSEKSSKPDALCTAFSWAGLQNQGSHGSYVATHSGPQTCTEQDLQAVRHMRDQYIGMFNVKVLTQDEMQERFMQLYMYSVTKHGEQQIASLFPMITATTYASRSFEIPLQESTDNTD